MSLFSSTLLLFSFTYINKSFHCLPKERMREREEGGEREETKMEWGRKKPHKLTKRGGYKITKE